MEHRYIDKYSLVFLDLRLGVYEKKHSFTSWWESLVLVENFA